MNFINLSCEQLNRMKNLKPDIKITKNPIPIIYLDTCLLIEFSKHENGNCDNSHKDEISKLYNTLVSLMSSKQIICVLGNQMEEMGSTPKRGKARNFLYRFTNAILFEPFDIEQMQIHKGYNAFVKSEPTISFDSSDFFEKPHYIQNSSIQINVPIIYKQERAKKIRQIKESLAFDLNNMIKAGKVSKDYNTQLATELNADFEVFRYNLEHCYDSIEAYEQNCYNLAKVYQLSEINLYPPDNLACKKAVEVYCNFLLSECHHALPYVWIRSVLFTRLMQRPNKIIPSDNWDIIWASAYLPFVDYVVTDDNFNNLLHASNLLTQYNTKSYSMKTLKELINDLQKIPLTE